MWWSLERPPHSPDLWVDHVGEGGGAGGREPAADGERAEDNHDRGQPGGPDRPLDQRAWADPRRSLGYLAKLAARAQARRTEPVTTSGPGWVAERKIGHARDDMYLLCR